MQRTSIPFTSSDVWVFLALSYAAHRGPATLRAVIEAGDFINKAVFTPQELRRGFAKLIATGLAEEESLCFSLTSAARELLASTERRSVYDQWKLIERELGAVRGRENDPGYEDAKWSFGKLTDGVVRSAVSEYSAGVENCIRANIRQPPND